jgi:hypothetical protein
MFDEVTKGRHAGEPFDKYSPQRHAIGRPVPVLWPLEHLRDLYHASRAIKTLR